MPKKKQTTARKPEPRSFFCQMCGRKIRMPKGWSRGSSVRRHYWAKHPEIMQPDKERR